MKYLQSQIGTMSEGYSLMGDIPVSEMLPPPILPSGCNNSVIWIPTIPSEEDEAAERIYSLLLFEKDDIQVDQNPSVTILYTNKITRLLAKKLITVRLRPL